MVLVLYLHGLLLFRSLNVWKGDATYCGQSSIRLDDIWHHFLITPSFLFVCLLMKFKVKKIVIHKFHLNSFGFLLSSYFKISMVWGININSSLFKLSQNMFLISWNSLFIIVSMFLSVFISPALKSSPALNQDNLILATSQ